MLAKFGWVGVNNMPKALNSKCAHCSTQTAAWARLNHADCWREDNRCNSKRSFYRKQAKAALLQEDGILVTPSKQLIMPVLVLYMHDEELHAISAHLRVNDEPTVVAKRQHAIGWSLGNVTDYATQLLKALNAQSGNTFPKFKAQLRAPALPCPIENCPLCPER